MNSPGTGSQLHGTPTYQIHLGSRQLCRLDAIIWIQSLGVTFFTVYQTPNDTMLNFRHRLYTLKEIALSMNRRILVGMISMRGDLNDGR